MLGHLVQAEAELTELSKLPVEPSRPDRTMSVAAYKASQKRKVIEKLREAIRHRLAWHVEQLALAEAAGFTATSDHEPKKRSVAHPRTSSHA
jgi:hypothetical protein